MSRVYCIYSEKEGLFFIPVPDELQDRDQRNALGLESVGEFGNISSSLLLNPIFLPTYRPVGRSAFNQKK